MGLLRVLNCAALVRVITGFKTLLRSFLVITGYNQLGSKICDFLGVYFATTNINIHSFNWDFRQHVRNDQLKPLTTDDEVGQNP